MLRITKEAEALMTRSETLHRALWASAFFNACGSVLFFAPARFVQLVPMPLPVPILYSWFCAAVIAIFGGVNAWLALQRRPSRPVLAICAIGKIAFFAVCIASWLNAESSGHLVAVSSLDMVFAVIFLACMPGAETR